VFYCSLLFFQCKSITATKSQSFFRTTFSASLTNVMVLLPQSRDSSCYISRPILALTPLWLHKHTDLCALSRMVTWLWLVIVTCACSWRFYGITPATPNCRYMSGLPSEFHKAHSCSNKSRNVRFCYFICFEFWRVMRLSWAFS